MSGQLPELLTYLLLREGIGNKPANELATQFGSLGEFLDVDPTELRYASGRRLRDSTRENVVAAQTADWLDADDDPRLLLVEARAQDFAEKALDSIAELELDSLSVNPLLIQALNLKRPEELVTFFVHQRAGRAVMTSMGFFVELLLESASPQVSTAGTKSNWDLVKTDRRGEHWLQIKSGPSALDIDQIRYWRAQIRKKRGRRRFAYIGIAYGDRNASGPISLGLLRRYLDDFDKETLIGRELWDFVIGDTSHTDRLVARVRTGASRGFSGKSFEEAVDDAIERLRKELVRRHGRGIPGVERYVQSIF